MIAGVVLAAGAGTRFGDTKQVAELDGRPLLEHVLATAQQAPLDRTVVVLGADRERVLGTVDLHGAEPVECERWDEGQAASLACGLARTADAEAVVVLLGDQPGVALGAVRRVIAGRGQAPAVRATYDGEPGHPVLLERSLFGPLRNATGDAGARNVLAGAGVHELACDDLGGAADVDTLEQLAVLRKRVG